MSRLRIGVVRYASVGNRIAAALGVQPAPEVILGARVKDHVPLVSRWECVVPASGDR